MDKLYQKYLESVEMWCLRKTGDISRIDHVKNEKVLQRVTEEINIIQTTKLRKANWMGHSLHRNCLLKRVIQEKIEGTERRGRRHRQLLDENILEIRFGRGCGPVVRQTT